MHIRILMTDQVIFRRENPDNVFITERDVMNILNKYGVTATVSDLTLFQKAFVHRSYLKIDSRNVIEESVEGCTVPLQEECNERLELLGDCILGSVVGTYLFTRFCDQPEGFLTKTKTKIVRGKTLGKLGKRMGFGKWVIISLHVETEGGRNSIRILEDLFECFIGALYLDNGGNALEDDWFEHYKNYQQIVDKVNSWEQEHLDNKNIDSNSIKQYIELNQQLRNVANKVIGHKSNGYLICQRFIMNVLEQEIDLIKLINLNDNYKDRLQSYFQKNFNGIFPEWKTLSVEGPTNDRWHTVGVKDDRGVLIGVGKARKKIEAEQKASKHALRQLGVEVISDSEDEDEYYMKNKLTNLK